MVELDGKENLYVVSVSTETITIKKLLAHSKEEAEEIARKDNSIGYAVKTISEDNLGPYVTIMEEQLAHERDIF